MVNNMNYGLQLYSIRDITPEDFEGALKKVSEIGYKMVEPAGFFSNDAKDVAAWLKKYRAAWLLDNKESELAEIEKVFTAVDALSGRGK